MSARSRLAHAVWRGLRGIVRLLELLGDRWFDLRFGTDTAKWAELEDLGIDISHRRNGRRYQPTMAGPFAKLMRLLDLPNDSVFVDLGSGKGKVLLMASQCPFKRVMGIEYSSQLCEIASRNVSLYCGKLGRDLPIEIVQTDATDYAIKDDENVFFMHDPFRGETLKQVIASIAASFERQPRKIWLIYANPVCSDIVESQGVFEKVAEYRLSPFGDPFAVYVANGVR